MNVLPVNPHGYCMGVHAALSLALKTKQQYPDRDVYMLGLLVHNETAVEFLKEHGLIPLDETKQSILDHILDRKEGDVVIFSAHGHPAAYEDLAKAKGLIVVDATCRYVQENLDAGLTAPSPVLYIGVEGHLESEAFLANCPEATFYDVKSGHNELLRLRGVTESPTIITQTTLSSIEIDAAMEEIRKIFPGASILKQRCFATTARQQAIEQLPQDVDAVIVLGSNRSNNSLKLAEIARKGGKEVFLCLGLKEVQSLKLKGKKRLALCSGASTSNETFDECLNYLRGLDL